MKLLDRVLDAIRKKHYSNDMFIVGNLNYSERYKFQGWFNLAD